MVDQRVTRDVAILSSLRKGYSNAPRRARDAARCELPPAFPRRASGLDQEQSNGTRPTPPLPDPLEDPRRNDPRPDARDPAAPPQRPLAFTDPPPRHRRVAAGACRAREMEAVPVSTGSSTAGDNAEKSPLDAVVLTACA